MREAGYSLPLQSQPWHVSNLLTTRLTRQQPFEVNAMSLIIDVDLPAHTVLGQEGITMKTGATGSSQEWIQPLRVGVINLMPKKVETETQLARLLGSSPFPVRIDFIKLDGHQPKNTPTEHIDNFYRPLSTLADEQLDGVIITGAPIEHLDFEDVEYWNELCHAMDWAKTHAFARMGICWGAMAMAYHWHGLPKHDLPAKAFGCYPHFRDCKTSPFLNGFADGFDVPVSRMTEIRQSDVDDIPALETLLTGAHGGPALINDTATRSLLVLNHFEYEWDTLKQEYERDIAAGVDIALPTNYFPNNDPTRKPINHWRWQGNLLYWNWLATLAENKLTSSISAQRKLPYAI